MLMRMGAARSHDWWYMPRKKDIRPASDINRKATSFHLDVTLADTGQTASWDYGSASSTPPKNVNDMCFW